VVRHMKTVRPTKSTRRCIIANCQEVMSYYCFASPWLKNCKWVLNWVVVAYARSDLRRATEYRCKSAPRPAEHRSDRGA